MNDSEFEDITPFSEIELSEIERSLGRPLSQDYREFAKRIGGAFVGGSLDGLDKFDVIELIGPRGYDGFFARMEQRSDLTEVGAVTVAISTMGDLYVLNSDDTVCFLKYRGGTVDVCKVAESFGEFISRLVATRD